MKPTFRVNISLFKALSRIVFFYGLVNGWAYLIFIAVNDLLDVDILIYAFLALFLFLTLFCGFFVNRAVRLISIILMLCVIVFYYIEILYFFQERNLPQGYLYLLFLGLFVFPVFSLYFSHFRKINFTNKSLVEILDYKINNSTNRTREIISLFIFFIVLLILIVVILSLTKYEIDAIIIYLKEILTLDSMIQQVTFVLLIIVSIYFVSKVKLLVDIIFDYKKNIDSTDNDKILYLRSFNDDRKKIFTIFDFFSSLDRTIKRSIPNEYDFVALGNIGERYFNSGTIRSNYELDNWKDKVKEHMSYSKAIILYVGDSPSILWEIETVFSNNYKGKTIFILPSGNNDKYFNVFKELTDEVDFGRRTVSFFIADNKFVVFSGRKRFLSEWMIHFIVSSFLNELNAIK